MAAPVPSWNTVRVFGTWHNLDGTMKAGKARVTIPVRVTNAPNDAIIPAGSTEYAFQTDNAGAPSLDIQVPATDDPDNTPTGWQVTILVTFTDQSVKETYVLNVPVAGGDIDLRQITLPQTLGSPQPVIVGGVAGGFALLDSSGNVIDASGTVITGGGGGGGAVTTVAGRVGDVVLTKSDVGLNNVNNTADANKPVSTAAQAALDLKAPLASPTFTGTVSGVTKTAVGLGAVDNTADTAKPVSTAQQTALNLKATKAGDTYTGAHDFTAATLTGIPGVTPPVAAQVGIFYVDPVNGNDAGNGRAWTTAVASIAQAVTLAAANANVGVIKLSRGVHNVTATIVLPQAISIEGFGPLASQQTEVVWTGADDGSYVIRTASNTSGADWTQGRLSGFLLRPNASKPGGGAYTNLNGLHLRNAQNSARVSDIQVKNFPGLGVMADWENAGVPSDGFPGYVTLERVWSSGNNVNWHVYGGFTSLLFNMCAGDVSSNTTDVFILDGRTGGTLGGRGGNYIFIGFKSEDNGTPTGAGADPNYFTINTDFGVQFDGCSGKRSTPGTKPWINYTATPTSQNAVAGGIPLTIRNSHTSNMPVMVKGPDGANWLAPAVGSGGQSFQVAEWNGQNQAPKKWTGTHSGFVADGVSVNATDNTANALHVGSAPFPTVAPVQFDGPVLKHTFTAADSTSAIPTPDKGSAGSALVGTWGISSNKAYLSSATHNAVYIFAGVAVDGTLHCDVTKSSGLGSPGLAFRVIDATHGLFVYYKRFTGELALMKHAGSTPVVLKVANITWAAGATKHVAVSMVGPVITVYLDGVQVITWTLTGGDEVTYGSATGVGLRQNGNSTADSTNYDDGGTRYDNLSFVAPTFRMSPDGDMQKFTAGAWTNL